MAEKVRSRFPASLLWMLDNKFREKYGNHKSLLLKLGVSRGMRVLEPGCGPGIITQSISSIVGEHGWIFAFDVNSKMIERARQRLSAVKTVSFAICTAHQIPITIPRDLFDAIVFYYVLHEVADREKLLFLYSSFLHKDGLLIITEPRVEVNQDFLRAEIRQAKAAGFELVNQSQTLPFRLELVFRKV